MTSEPVLLHVELRVQVDVSLFNTTVLETNLVIEPSGWSDRSQRQAQKSLVCDYGGASIRCAK